MRFTIGPIWQRECLLSLFVYQNFLTPRAKISWQKNNNNKAQNAGIRKAKLLFHMTLVRFSWKHHGSRKNILSRPIRRFCINYEAV